MNVHKTRVTLKKVEIKKTQKGGSYVFCKAVERIGFGKTGKFVWWNTVNIFLKEEQDLYLLEDDMKIEIVSGQVSIFKKNQFADDVVQLNIFELKHIATTKKEEDETKEEIKPKKAVKKAKPKLPNENSKETIKAEIDPKASEIDAVSNENDTDIIPFAID